MIDGLNTTWCYVSDMNRAVAFYRDLLGLKATYVSPYWSQFDLGNGYIGLHPKEGDGPFGRYGNGWNLGMSTSDLKAVRAKIEEAGQAIADDYHQTPTGVVLTISDPDGNPIQIMQPGSKMEQFQ